MLRPMVPLQFLGFVSVIFPCLSLNPDYAVLERLKSLEELFARQERTSHLQDDRLAQQEVKIAQQEVRLAQQESRLQQQENKIQEQEREIRRLQKELESKCSNFRDHPDTSVEEETTQNGNDTTVDASKLAPVSLRRVSRQAERVAFSAYLDHTMQHLGIDHPIVYNRVLLNEGTAYNEHSGMFTCPMDGLYVFYFSVSSNGAGHQIVAKLVVDAANEVDAIADTYHQYHEAQGSNLAAVSLRQGQQVWVSNYRWTDKSVETSDVDRFSSFSGFLLY